MALRVGQKVSCIDDTFDAKYGEALPVKGRQYTIRQVIGGCVRLKEIVNTPHPYSDGLLECSFKATRFKPGKK